MITVDSGLLTSHNALQKTQDVPAVRDLPGRDSLWKSSKEPTKN